VDGFAGDTEVFGGRSVTATLRPNGFTTFLRRVILISQAAFGSGFDLERVSLCAMYLRDQFVVSCAPLAFARCAARFAAS
jgi:hypothetical protein